MCHRLGKIISRGDCGNHSRKWLPTDVTFAWLKASLAGFFDHLLLHIMSSFSVGSLFDSILNCSQYQFRLSRFFTDDYIPEVYTQWGLDYVDGTTFVDVIRRHYPKLRKALEGVENAFAPWDSPANRDGLQEVARSIVEMKRMAWNNMVGKPNKV